MKKFLMLLALSSLLIPCGSDAEIGKPVNAVKKGASSTTDVLRIYSWEDYIYEDEETGKNLIDEYEDWYETTYNKQIEVVYDTFDTNETMYNQLQLGKTYDLLCPSDYMIEKLMKNDALEPFDFTNIPNYSDNLSPYLKNVFDDAGFGNYAAGYMWGTVGMIYNPAFVTDEDVKTWNVLWNSKYKNKVSIKDSMRDTYMLGIFRVYRHALALLNEQVQNGLVDESYYNGKVNEYFNLCDDSTVDQVEKALKDLKTNIYGFEVDSGKNDIVMGKININVAWSGDAVYSIQTAADEENTELRYSVPEEGSNVWFDGWVMPKGANKDLAENFINFISDPENAIKNMEYIGYTSFIAGDATLDYINDSYSAGDDETDTYNLDLSYFFGNTIGEGRSAIITAPASEKYGELGTQYPSEEIINRCGIMHDFGKQNDVVVQMWTNVKATQMNFASYIFIGLVVLGIIGYGTYVIVNKHETKKRRELRRANAKTDK